MNSDATVKLCWITSHEHLALYMGTILLLRHIATPSVMFSKRPVDLNSSFDTRLIRWLFFWIKEEDIYVYYKILALFQLPKIYSSKHRNTNQNSCFQNEIKKAYLSLMQWYSIFSLHCNYRILRFIFFLFFVW